MELTSASLPKVKRTEVGQHITERFRTESQFMGLAVDITIEVASYSCIASSITGKSEYWDRDHAVIGGNMVRLYKLFDILLDQVSQSRGESIFIVTRLIYETMVNIRYLIENYSNELIDSYVIYSMRHERKLRDRIIKAIDDRGGKILPIEERMLNSINRAAKAAAISLDDINTKDKSPWGGKNTYDKSVAVGLEAVYLSAVGGGSHAIHGNWQNLYEDHLSCDDKGNFSPNLEWTAPRPQVLTTVCLLMVETLKTYFEFMCPEKVEELFINPLSDIYERVSVLSAAHEAYLKGKVWPET